MAECFFRNNSFPVVGRLAPSPTGRMHAGNIFAALMAWLITKSQNGTIVLRIENLDADRSKPAFIDAVQRDFEMLGLPWDKGPFFQHDRTEAYQAAYENLDEQGLVYPCFCSRADLHVASAPHQGDKPIYPGTCSALSNSQRYDLSLVRRPARRIRVPAREISFVDLLQGEYRENLVRDCGDFLIQRSDGAFAYQLAVVVDDAEQGITSVVRGVDLLSSTPQQIYLQQLLGLPQPLYTHIPLLVDQDSRRLSKRNRDASLEELLARFKTPETIIGHLAGLAGLTATNDPVSPEELVRYFELNHLRDKLVSPAHILWE